MKILIISDDDSFISQTNVFFKNKSFDTIIYRWLLKALDNIEEIQPDVVLISANEYPRHWKTLTQFIKSGIGGNNIAIFLYDKNELSDDDKRKVSLLEINGIIKEVTTDSLGDKYKKIELFFKKEETINSDVMITNPKTKMIANGKISLRGDNCKIIFDFPEALTKLQSGDVINYISFNIGDDNITKKGKISTISTDE